MPEDTYTDIRRMIAEAASDMPSSPPQPRRTVRRARRRAFVSGSVACLAAVAIAVGSVHMLRAWTRTDSIPLIDPPLHTAYHLVDVSDGSVASFQAPDGGTWFRFSPDGSEVIFVNDDAHGRHQIYRMHADGSQVTRIDLPHEWAAAGDEPAWSPDGKWIAYSGILDSGRRHIIAMQSDGYHPPRADLSWDAGDSRTPSWSADGTRIAFVVNGIYAMGVSYYAGGDSITSDEPPRLILDGTSPTWSPDGGVIAFTSGEGSGRRVALANEDGTHVREITTSTSERPLWSPDGSMIAYNVWTSGSEVAVWLYDPRTEHHRLLLDGASAESWKDDGTLLVSTPGKI
jgi:Tol biopolymer transport system component